ncbi:hypothetical protein [Streptomyces sp. NPDC058385]|uniref:hypothetical protein n=1 Tax=Streptomyces sp. NPDC058385 TaxID=3346473 RepID=UPI003646F857
MALPLPHLTPASPGDRPPHRSIGLVTALSPHIGYAASTDIASQALATGRGIRDLTAETGLLTREQLAVILCPENLTGQPAQPAEPNTQ